MFERKVFYACKCSSPDRTKYCFFCAFCVGSVSSGGHAELVGGMALSDIVLELLCCPDALAHSAQPRTGSRADASGHGGSKGVGPDTLSVSLAPYLWVADSLRI